MVSNHQKMLKRFTRCRDRIGCKKSTDPFLREVNNEFDRVTLWRTLLSYHEFEHDEEIKTLLVEL